MEVITSLIGLEEKPTPTWCRHSYATNLRDTGVPTEYISTMMGHTMTSGSTTTLNYLSRYNMDTMVAYNSKLLADKAEDKKREEILEELNGLDTETLATFLKLTKLKKKKEYIDEPFDELKTILYFCPTIKKYNHERTDTIHHR